MFWTEVVKEIKNTNFMFSNIFQKSCCLYDNVEKYSRVRQATDDNIKRRLRVACWIPKSTNTPTQIAFPLQ